MKVKKSLFTMLLVISIFAVMIPLSAGAAYDIDPNIDLAKAVNWGTAAYSGTGPAASYQYSFGQNWVGALNLNMYPPGTRTGASCPAATGVLRVAVIFMDATDRRATQVTQTSPIDYRLVANNFNVLSPLPDFFRQASFGQLKVELVNVNAEVNDSQWFNGTRTTANYGAMSTQVNEAVAFAFAKGFDFTDINYAVVFSPRGGNPANSMTAHGSITLPLPGGGSKTASQYFNIGNNIWSWARPWTVLAHEMGHTLNMIDLYTYTGSGASAFSIKNEHNSSEQWFHFIGGWDLEGDCAAGAPDNLAWHKWKVRWLKDEQVRVVVPGSAQTVTLAANAYWDMDSADRAADGVKMIFIPTETVRPGTSTQSQTGYVIESRRPIGNDAPGSAAPGGSQAFAGAPDKGVLIYRLDSTGPNTANGGHGRGGIKVIDGNPDRVNQKLISSTTSLRTPCFGFASGQAPIFRDELRNITIQVIAQDGLSDTVTVTYGDPIITASQEIIVTEGASTVEFTLSNSIGLTSGAYDILYDPALLKPVAYDFSHLPKEAAPVADLNFAPGIVQVAYAHDSNISMEGALFSLTFETAPGAPMAFEAVVGIEPQEAAVAYNNDIEMGPIYTTPNFGGGNTVTMNTYVRVNGPRPVNVSPLSGLVVRFAPERVVPAATVKQLNGSKNELKITVTEFYASGVVNVLTSTYTINNNTAATYIVGPYKVYVDTKGNTQVRACNIIE